PQADVRGRLRRAITLSIEFSDQRRDLLRLMMTEEPRMPEARNRLREEWRDRTVRFLNSLLEEGIQSGVFRAVDARLATFAILGAIRSVMLFYGVQRPVDQICDELGEMVIRGLGPDSSANHRKVARDESGPRPRITIDRKSTRLNSSH